ncbi:hypothetical protein CWB99_02820 [Pseudoalteromonas rubra]|uniref:DUF3574 domain-containing protein n=1 Tax=Pseudoalteromonas rubra TaxID=43658 RepID=A0A5S3WU25_9GAMM|nr:DUF3574 domain-containing protein [Pseudoalteromonas rubra]TMP30221.1 hypothetical protein CWC00_17665 [Pseudoalteromonas rubra]TMP31910.1 hypothetical protein CWB99_02820 [Pseudoalteromonas rubra]
MTVKLISRFVLLTLLLSASSAYADEVYRLRLFFGLSLPGGGGVSLEQWQAFQNDEIVKTFDGFNVVDSVGYYKGKPERSKVVTVIVDEQGVEKAKVLASLYARRFGQESVMLVKVPVAEWDFIGPDYKSATNGQ